MATYKIISNHFVCEDNYENGEGRTVNSYELSLIVNADSPLQAIEQYYAKQLFKTFNPKTIAVDGEKTNVIHDTFIEDENGTEPSKSLLESWKKGHTKYLYANNAVILVSEVVPVDVSTLFEA